MKAKLIVIGFGIVLCLVPTSCTHEVEQKVEAQLQNESVPKDGDAIGNEAKQRIEESKKLSQLQKQQLLALQANTKHKLDVCRNDSLKLRSLMLKELMKSNYDSQEIALIKTKLKHTEDTRLNTIFAAVDRANEILGHESNDREMYLRDIIQEHGRM